MLRCIDLLLPFSEGIAIYLHLKANSSIGVIRYRSHPIYQVAVYRFLLLNKTFDFTKQIQFLKLKLCCYKNECTESNDQSFNRFVIL